jgi:hypothetical protein
MPPWAEDPSPQGHLIIAWTQNATMTTTFATDASIAGMEVESNAFASFTFSADFLDAGGATLATITRTVVGDSGARLFGVECSDAVVHSIRINSPFDAQGFAIAQVRSDMFSAGASEDSVRIPSPFEVPEGATTNAGE